MFGTVHQYGHHFTTRKNYATVEIWLADWVMDDLTIFIFLPIALLSPGEHSPTNKLKTLDYAGDGHHLEK